MSSKNNIYNLALNQKCVVCHYLVSGHSIEDSVKCLKKIYPTMAALELYLKIRGYLKC